MDRFRQTHQTSFSPATGRPAPLPAWLLFIPIQYCDRFPLPAHAETHGAFHHSIRRIAVTAHNTVTQWTMVGADAHCCTILPADFINGVNRSLIRSISSSAYSSSVYSICSNFFISHSCRDSPLTFSTILAAISAALGVKNVCLPPAALYSHGDGVHFLYSINSLLPFWTGLWYETNSEPASIQRILCSTVAMVSMVSVVVMVCIRMDDHYPATGHRFWPLCLQPLISRKWFAIELHDCKSNKDAAAMFTNLWPVSCRFWFSFCNRCCAFFCSNGFSRCSVSLGLILDWGCFAVAAIGPAFFLCFHSWAVFFFLSSSNAFWRFSGFFIVQVIPGGHSYTSILSSRFSDHLISLLCCRMILPSCLSQQLPAQGSIELYSFHLLVPAGTMYWPG